MVVDMRTMVLDAGGVLALAHRTTRARDLLAEALELNMPVSISAATLAEVIRGNGPRDAPINRIVKGVEVVPVSEEIGRSAGLLLARAGSKATIDAIVAATARTFRHGAVVMTSDPDDLGKLTAELSTVEVVPV